MISVADACAAAIDWRAGGDLGPMAGTGLLALDLESAGSSRLAPEGAASLLRDLPVVVVGVPGRDSPPDPLLAVVDVLLAEGGASDASTGDAVPVASVVEAVSTLAATVEAAPAAALALVQLLRAGVGLSTVEAVLAESWVYSMLQGGPRHRTWLADRAPRRAHRQDRPPVRTVREGSALHVVLDRPEVRNAVDTTLRDGTCAALAVAAADPSVEEVHLWGDGPSFCAGGDLAEFGSSPDPATAHLVRSTRSPALALAGVAGRVTAHVQGAAVGAGVEWAAFARRVVARDDAVFRLPELAMGLVPGAGGTASLPRRIGRRRTAWMALTGEPVDARTARDWGLVDEVVAAAAFGAPPA